jgi:hypothetical protein
MDRHYRGGLQACRYVVIVEMGRQAAWWIAVNMHQTGLRLEENVFPFSSLLTSFSSFHRGLTLLKCLTRLALA